MKKVKILIWIALLMSLMLGKMVSASVVRIPFTATESTPVILDPGEWTYPGDNQHFRGMVELARVTSDCDMMTGTNHIIANGNFDANGFGVVWGTNTLEVDAYDGYWEGQFVGRVDENGMTLRGVGKGYGELAGYQVRISFENFVLEGVITQLPNN